MTSFILKMQLLLFIIFMIFFYPLRSCAYSTLTHEAIVDAAWDKNIVPLLKLKFPGANDSEIKQARAYAYGGALIPDIRGSKLFGDLMHYVRNGYFIKTMLQDAADINEYAFALGVLSHYYGDCYGHPLGINRAVPLIFPKLRERLGDSITYSQHETSHLRTELSFDVLQTVRGNYNSEAYHNYIGFKISEPLLKKVFVETYGLPFDDVFPNFPKALRRYRWAVRDVFPLLTRTAWRAKRKEIAKTSPQATRRSYIYRMRATDYYREYSSDYKPGVGARIMAVVVRIMPKAGPFKKLKIVVPGPDAEKLFVNSFDSTTKHYTAYIANIATPLADRDYDTGENTQAGAYDMADNTYADLLLELKAHGFKNVPPELKQDIISFYKQPGAALAMNRSPHRQSEIREALKELETK
jgi:hypothetical protein